MINYFDEEGGDEAESFLVREGGPGQSKSVWELKVYGLAHELGVAAHHLSMKLPKHELFETGSQLRRAAKSVSANIVEGYGRRAYKAEFLRFLTIAKASLDETEEHLQYVRDCHPDHQAQATALLDAANTLGRRLHCFMTSLEAQHRT